MKYLKTTIFLFLVVIGISFYISDFVLINKILFMIITYTLFFYFLIGISKILFKRKNLFLDKNFVLNLFLKVTKTVSILFLIIYGIIGSVIYNELYLNPAKMPIYKISNGEKEVVFHAMSHIGSEKFYKNISNNILELKKKGFVLFYEGVKQGSKENHEIFTKALGIKIDEDFYKNFSILLGLKYQDNNDFIGLENNLDYNIDLSIDEIVAFYKNIIKELNIENNNDIIKEETIDFENFNNLLNKEIGKISKKEFRFISIISKTIMSIFIKNNNLQLFVKDNFKNKELFNVILNKRDELVANEIINSEYDKIVITYGLLHFEGIFNYLKNYDYKWDILEIKYLDVIK